MSEELDKQLVEVLKSTTETIGNAKDFIIGEMPDVVYQLLLWYGIYNFIMFLVGIIGIISTIYAVKKTWGTSLTHETFRKDITEVGPQLMVYVPVVLIAILVWVSFMNLTWLKIWVAPKIWLIEYTATLVK